MSTDTTYLPYGRHSIDADDIEAVIAVLRSDWLTTGPKIPALEQAFAEYTGTKTAVAVSSGTAALHATMHALGIGPGDEVIVPCMTFVASVNCIVYQGATPVFADIDAATMLVDCEHVKALITPRTKAIIAVDFAGQPCDYNVLTKIAHDHHLYLVADACHSLGGRYHNRLVGSLAHANVFSLHPVKTITAGEGGIITTNDEQLAAKIRRFCQHGIDKDHHQRLSSGSWSYDMVELGFNYRITDLQSALALSQLTKLDDFTCRRVAIAKRYDNALKNLANVHMLVSRPESGHAYHLYVVRVDGDRSEWFKRLRQRGIGVNVHYMPVHLHHFYRHRFGTAPGLCPVAEKLYDNILSLPIFAAMDDADSQRVIDDMVHISAELS